MPYTNNLFVFDNEQVMGRSSPTDKLLLVQTLRKQGEVVAVTGDGTNDAPALHEVCCAFIMLFRIFIKAACLCVSSYLHVFIKLIIC